jgi:predicted TIM-barrel fold metal-dependent hydrolase
MPGHSTADERRRAVVRQSVQNQVLSASDLRGRLDIFGGRHPAGRESRVLFEVKDVDRQAYAQKLADFLPRRIIDIHSHVWLKEFRVEPPPGARGQTWPRKVAADNSIDDLLESYRLLLPEQEVTPVVFGWPERNTNLEQTNAYASQAALNHHLAALLVTTPEWTGVEVERRVRAGGFIGLKPYLTWAPLEIPQAEITIFDFLPHAHLEPADRNGWLVMLHIPRPDRLRDRVNLAQMLEIEERYPNLQLVIAHIGRAYCPEDLGNAFEMLRPSKRMVFDFSANASPQVIEGALRAAGPQRVVFGSDLPILRMRMRRICEDGIYVNLVPPGLYGDVSGDPHMREVSAEEGAQLSFFLYEQLGAFRRAAEALGLSRDDIEDVFYNTAARIIREARASRGISPWTS